MKNFLVSFLLALIMGTVISSFLGINTVAGMGGAVAFSAAQSFMPKQEGALKEVVLTELHTSELINKFRHINSWIGAVPSYDEWVGNNVIRLHDIGADPEVLIDNKTYPIPVVTREDDNIAISLHKYETVNTRITKDELYGLPYDKPGSVQRQHRETLEERTGDHGSHICAPDSQITGKTFFVETSGEDDGTGRKRLITKDLVLLKKQYDDAKVPKQGRVLRLCNEHVMDLLIEDKAFEKQYMNHTAGAIATNYYGFMIYEEHYNPVYNGSNVKKAFGAASEGSDRNASIACYLPYTAKARGTVEMFYRDARTDPEFRSHIAGFELWHLVIPKKIDGLGAVISVPV